MNKQEDPVVGTWKRNFKNNVILLLNVEVLELVKNAHPQTKPLV